MIHKPVHATGVHVFKVAKIVETVESKTVVSNQQSRKLAAIRSSRAISREMGNSGISVLLLV